MKPRQAHERKNGQRANAVHDIALVDARHVEPLNDDIGDRRNIHADSADDEPVVHVRRDADELQHGETVPDVVQVEACLVGRACMGNCVCK